MSAPIKTKGTCEPQVSEKIYNAVVSAIARRDEGVSSVKVDVNLVGHGLRPFGDYGQGAYIDFSVSVEGKKFDGLGRVELAETARKLNGIKSASVDVESKGLYFSYGNFAPDMEFPSVFRTFGKPCKQFKELQKLAARKGLTIDVKDLYKVRLFGKRGVYDESGERDYTAYNPRRCESIISGIKAWGRKRVTLKVETVDDVDDLEYSIRYETECYGSRLKTIHVERKTA